MSIRQECDRPTPAAPSARACPLAGPIRHDPAVGIASSAPWPAQPPKNGSFLPAFARPPGIGRRVEGQAPSASFGGDPVEAVDRSPRAARRSGLPFEETAPVIVRNYARNLRLLPRRFWRFEMTIE